MRPIRVTGPAESPVDLAELKLHTRIDSSDEDTLIQAYLDAAINHLDGYQGILGRCMVTQTWRLPFDWPRCGKILLPFPDVSSVTALDEDGVEILDISVTEQSCGAVADVGAAYAAQLDFTAGFGAAAEVPQALKVAIMMHAASMYEHRSAVAETGDEVPFGYLALVTPYRWMRVS